ncbi:fibronectin type III domain-containing protein [Spirillospora albida]|uniref:fibronectin type III domain-containing protein n=1 Tax=Spirillospora albida TaxID=58123 RepID=UPI0004BF3616|nr:fibronectin type III domain-containing protein [Spirillospora albida]
MGSSLQHARTRVLVLATALVMAAAGLVVLAWPGQLARADTGTSGQFVSLPLVGLYDTLSGVNAPVAEIPANGSVTVQVAGKAGIPASGVSAVALNIWKRGGSDGYGYLVLRPSDKPSTAVTLYYNPTDHNSTDDLIRLTSTGKLTLTNTGPNPVDVRIAVRGYFLDASATQAATEYHPLNAAYIYDSRPGIGPADGPKTPLASKTPITLQVTGKAGIPATGVDSVAINIAALGATTNAGLSLWADGESDPTSSTLLYTAGENNSLTDIVRVGTGGRIRLVNHGANPINVAIAVRGYFKKTTTTDTDGAGFEAVEPKTLLRTDSGVGTPGGTTTPLAARASLTFTATSATSTPMQRISAVAGSLTAFQPAATGSLSITPTGGTEAKLGTLQFMKGETSQLTDIVRPGTDGKLTVTNHSDSTVHVQFSIRGYFVRPEPLAALTELTATPSDRQGTDGVRVTDAAPVLSATASDGAGPITYTFEVAPALSGAPVASGTRSAVPVGQPATWTVPAGRLTNPGAYRFRVKVDDGRDALWSAWKALTVDAPLVPATLDADLGDPEVPVLSGTVSRPSNGIVTGRFNLFDSAGRQLGASPIGQGTVQGGQRVSLRLPEGLVRLGQSYQWQMDACVGASCTPRSALTNFTAEGTGPQPETRSLTLASDKISVRTAKVGAQACDGSACPLADDTAVRVGGTSTDAQLSALKVDLASLPAGARVTSVTIDLGSPSCAPDCPDAVTLSAHQLAENLSAQPTGAETEEKLLPDAVTETTSSASPKLDLGELGAIWQHGADENDGVFLRTQGQDLPEITIPASTISATVTYIPAGPPGMIEGPVASAGDGAALVTWTPPSDPGAAGEVTEGEDATETSPISEYEIEAVGPDGQVLRTVTTPDTQVKISDLSNGTAYLFRIRARSGHGPGPWASTPTVTPQAIPLGANTFVTTVKEYLSSQNGIMEGEFDTAAAAVEASSQGKRLRGPPHDTDRPDGPNTRGRRHTPGRPDQHVDHVSGDLRRVLGGHRHRHRNRHNRRPDRLRQRPRRRDRTAGHQRVQPREHLQLLRSEHRRCDGRPIDTGRRTAAADPDPRGLRRHPDSGRNQRLHA